MKNTKGSKIYTSRVNKSCSESGCRRPAHAHVAGQPFCSTHYRIAKVNFEIKELKAFNNLLRSVILNMERGSRKGEKRDIRLGLAITNLLNTHIKDQKRIAKYKRAIWIGVLKGDSSFLEDMWESGKIMCRP